VVQLSTKEISALHEALDDEYKAWATYDQVIDDFGPIRPFINIRDAESRHIDALLQIFNDYDLTAPSNNWVGRVPRYEDVQAACAAGVEAEIENGELYGRIIESTAQPDILAVYSNLRDASQERHLPAFQRCLERSCRRASTGRPR
jgi:hypothetical protein